MVGMIIRHDYYSFSCMRISLLGPTGFILGPSHYLLNVLWNIFLNLHLTVFQALGKKVTLQHQQNLKVCTPIKCPVHHKNLTYNVFLLCSIQFFTICTFCFLCLCVFIFIWWISCEASFYKWAVMSHALCHHWQ